MRFGHSVHRALDRSQLSASGLARTRLITDDPFGAFARRTLLTQPVRISIASPWISPRADEPNLEKVIEHAASHRATITLVTRPPTSEAHSKAIEMVQGRAKAHVFFNPTLHGKLYICESKDGRGFAVIGSANCTPNSASLDEIAVMISPTKGSRVISDLSSDGLVALMGKGNR